VNRLRRTWRSRRIDERGYVAILVAVLIPTVFMVCAAFAVDTGNWYAQQKNIQSAADAAALAGVPYLPNDMTDAITTAKTVAARNGYTDGTKGTTVTVSLGARPTQLKVVISTPVHNSFGQVIGLSTTQLTRTAVADYQGPSPMGSPCNTFGNEPASGGGTSSLLPTGTALAAVGTRYANCSSNPAYWPTIEGPETDKQQGDRYQTLACASNDSQNCANNQNSEYNKLGYVMVVKVQAAAVNTPVAIQLYDPAYIGDTQYCSDNPTSGFVASMNPWVGTDAPSRYGRTTVDSDGNPVSPASSSTGAPYCPGDDQPGSTSTHLMTTSFALRQQTDTLDPQKGAIISGCVKQYTGQLAVPTADELTATVTTGSGSKKTTKANPDYNDQLAQVYHNWTSLCTFTPTRAGDYYLQVQSDVAAGGTSTAQTGTTDPTNGNKVYPPIIYSGNTNVGSSTYTPITTGAGDNSFAVRAVTATGHQNDVSVSGYQSMAIFANAPGATSTFNLIRVLPGAAGQFVTFSFFDAGDATDSGTVKVAPPADALGTVKTKPFPGNCAAVGGNAGTGSSSSTCQFTITNTNNNGKIETMTIPIPGDYSCNYASMGGCWYQVTISFTGGHAVHDVTTWDAQVVGDPVRLIQ
jgi:Flp pilus assembly protein TadG